MCGKTEAAYFLTFAHLASRCLPDCGFWKVANIQRVWGEEGSFSAPISLPFLYLFLFWPSQHLIHLLQLQFHPLFNFLSISTLPLSLFIPAVTDFHSPPFTLFILCLSLSLSLTILLWVKTVNSAILGPSRALIWKNPNSLLIVSLPISSCHIVQTVSSSLFCLLLTC